MAGHEADRLNKLALLFGNLTWGTGNGVWEASEALLKGSGYLLIPS